MAQWVKGLLVPGTTGDAWELAPEERHEVVGIVLEEARRLDFRVLLGALQPDVSEARRIIQAGMEMLSKASGCVCGFAVCPPRGAHITAAEMEQALSGILGLGAPMALYQLPQVTHNEMSPALVAGLAGRFANFILFKDTSGTDRVAAAGLDLGGVFLVRGMEGAYARWLKAGGGPYDGLLLSTANSFAPQLHDIRELLLAQRPLEAQALSDRLARAVEELFKLVETVAGGNRFANAGKAADHFFAHGPRALAAEPPRLHSGGRLPVEVLRTTAEALDRYGFLPKRGYLE
jgi:dihydrodipicolinate synthase/N-acetylneuraminate lyase